MSSILTARYNRHKPQPAETKGVGSETLPPPQILSAFATPLDKSPKPVVSQNFGESLNNRTRAVNATKINRHDQSLAQVRYQNEKHVHYWIVYS